MPAFAFDSPFYRRSPVTEAGRHLPQPAIIQLYTGMGGVGVTELANTPDLVTALRNDIAQLRGVVAQVERNTDTPMRNRR